MSYYNVLKNKQSFSSGKYSIVPIRRKDRYDIMKWRNEQIYHLRQNQPLTVADQDRYFDDIIPALFSQDQPGQLLFSYLEDDRCIGYGGLVHINWVDQNAEISFIMDTSLEESYFHHHWYIYLSLIERVAFHELNLHKIFTFAFDVRPELYKILEASNYKREAVLKEHGVVGGNFIDVIIHTKIHRNIVIRKAAKNDEMLIFEWANDPLTRANSFNSSPITFEDHSSWFDKKINDANAVYFICELDNRPCGFVRFDIENGIATIGILIDKSYRGRGLACEFIMRCCRKFRNVSNATIVAVIKSDNIASKVSFENAGFLFVGEVSMGNYTAAKYQLK